VGKNNQFSPMLAKDADPKLIRFPVLASPKLDGVRAIKKDGKLLSRKLLPIPNLALQAFFAHVPEGYDGELIVGDPRADDCYNKTIREVMTINGPNTACYYIFDRWDLPYSFHERSKQISANLGFRVTVLTQVLIGNQEMLDTYEQQCVDAGYEGIMIRSLDGPYKFGRSTPREGYLLKVKRFVDSEAIILGMEEKMHNANEATVDETGHTKRSTHQENQHGLNTMGALRVKDCKTGVEFKVGTGFDDATRKYYWSLRDAPNLWPVIVYKSFPVGVKDKPRHPVYKGIRDRRDM
jgi:DNA ligase-1